MATQEKALGNADAVVKEKELTCAKT